MWLYLVALVGLWTLLRLFRERQVVSHLQDKYVFITGCDSGFGNLLARQLDRRGLRVLAACLTETGAEQLRSKTSDRLQTVVLDVTKTESVVAATQWVKEHVGDRGIVEIPVWAAGVSPCLKGASPSHSLTGSLKGCGGLKVTPAFCLSSTSPERFLSLQPLPFVSQALVLVSRCPGEGSPSHVPVCVPSSFLCSKSKLLDSE